MAEFLLEMYVRRDDDQTATLCAERARRVAADLTREGVPVRCLWSTFVAEDETCFLLFEAPSTEAVEEAAGRAGLTPDHISGAASSPGPGVAPASTAAGDRLNPRSA